MITIKDVADAKCEANKMYQIADICKYGYLIKNIENNEVLLKDSSWLEENSNNVAGFIGMCEMEEDGTFSQMPLIYSTDRNAYFIGNDFARIEVNIEIKDDEPNKRYYSNSVIKLDGKEITGKITSVDVKVEKVKYPNLSGCCSICKFTSYVPTKFKHCLSSQWGKLSLKGENVVFSSERKEEFRKYHSGCGYEEHYIIPNSDYVKYVSCEAKIGNIGDDFSLHYTVADDPEFLLKKKLDELKMDIDINADTVEWADCDGYYKETITNCNLYMAKNDNNDEYRLYVYYIPEEYKNHRKAGEYSNYLPINLFYDKIKDITSHEMKYDFLIAVQTMINNAKEQGFEVEKSCIEFVNNQLNQLNELQMQEFNKTDIKKTKTKGESR